MTYSEKLKHPSWQKKRLEILSRDGFKCCMCNTDEKTLHVHHKNYIYGKEIWDYPDENFETLCEDCHEWVEGNKISFKINLQQLLDAGVTYSDLNWMLYCMKQDLKNLKATEQKGQSNG